MRVLIYARVSTDKQETENQVVQLREYATKQGWEVVEVLLDVCSGGKGAKTRGGMKLMFEKARVGEFDLLLFWSLDRFSREGALPTLEYLKVLDGYKVQWHSYTQQYISSLGLFKDAVIAIIAAVAAMERAQISERTKAGLATARRNGKVLGRPRTDPKVIARSRELRAAGRTYSSIGAEMGVTSQRAFQMVRA